MGNKLFLSELLSFIRVETCFFITGIAVAGYAMFNEMGWGLLFLFLAMFAGTGASYGYNYLTDRKEDAINNKRLNRFVLKEGAGRLLVAALFLSGFAFSLFLSFPSFIFYSLLMFLSVVYSGLKIKRMFIVKNVFTGATIALAFIAGSLVSHKPEIGVLLYFPFVLLFGLTLNILGDIRGHEGDREAGIKTIPVVLGKNAAKNVVYLITAVFSVSVVLFGLLMLLPLLPFMIMIAFFIHREDHVKSRISILLSFIFFSVLMVMLNLLGGV